MRKQVAFFILKMDLMLLLRYYSAADGKKNVFLSIKQNLKEEVDWKRLLEIRKDNATLAHQTYT